jgi:hypothetical protein
MKKIIILCIIWIVLCIGFVSASIPITVAETGDSFIKWSWDSSIYTINNLSIDGYKVQYFDANSGTFLLSDLKPYETHILRISDNADYGISTANTTKPNATSESKIADYFWAMILLISGVICIIISSYFRTPFMAFGGFIFGCLGLVQSLNNIVISNITISNFMLSALYMIMIVASMFVAYNGSE